jgi:hypothetical protein
MSYPNQVPKFSDDTFDFAFVKLTLRLLKIHSEFSLRFFRWILENHTYFLSLFVEGEMLEIIRFI